MAPARLGCRRPGQRTLRRRVGPDPGCAGRKVRPGELQPAAAAAAPAQLRPAGARPGRTARPAAPRPWPLREPRGAGPGRGRGRGAPGGGAREEGLPARGRGGASGGAAAPSELAGLGSPRRRRPAPRAPSPAAPAARARGDAGCWGEPGSRGGGGSSSPGSG